MPEGVRHGDATPCEEVRRREDEDVLGLAAALAVGSVRDMGLLPSACHRPRSGTDDEAFDLTLAVAAGQLDSEDIEKGLRPEPVII